MSALGYRFVAAAEDTVTVIAATLLNLRIIPGRTQHIPRRIGNPLNYLTERSSRALDW